MLQRQFHQQTQDDYHVNHPQFAGRLLYFLLPYITLLLVSWFDYIKTVNIQLSTFHIYPLPSANAQKITYIIELVFLAVIGLYVLLGDYWTTYAWVLFAVINLLVALYLILYRLQRKFTLFLTAIAMVTVAVVTQWLFIQTANLSHNDGGLTVRNLVGAFEAWTLFFALITVGQVIVHDLQFSKKCQTFFFYIVGILFLVLLTIWNKSNYAEWDELIGFIVCSIILFLLATYHIHESSGRDLL